MKKPCTVLSLVLALVFLGASVATGLPIDPFAAAPLCPTHDDRAWHGLWDAERGCHYDHHHGSDPHALDSVFGTELFDEMGGEISHPWQTMGADGQTPENYAKHHGYYWIVLSGLPCTATNRITDVRALVHQHAELDFSVRYHSMVMQARGCDAEAGVWTAQLGGWHDRGDALVNGVPVLPFGDVVNDGNLEAQHRSNSGTQVWYTCLHGELVLNNCIARASLTIHDAWDPTSASNPTQTGDYICYPSPSCRFNATLLRSHLVAIEVIESLAAVVDADGDGLANWEGYANRWGTPVEGCGTISLDCIPMKFENLPVNTNYICDAVCAQIFVEHDVYFCNGVWCTASSPGARPSGWQQPHH